MPSIMGLSICMSWASHSPDGSSSSSPSGDGCESGETGGEASSGRMAPAIRSNRGRHASIVVSTHWVRVTGVTVTARPVTEVASPVALATWISATRASCSKVMRSSGSTFASLSPSVAIDSAS